MVTHFASDNNAPAHPAVLAALAAANRGHALAYGDDDDTRAGLAALREAFGPRAEPFLLLTGTAANVLAFKACTDSFHAVVCTDIAHANVDECGAPERFAGCKLYDRPHAGGKLRPEQVRALFHHLDFEHAAQPKVLSITQPTELGTVYTPGEVAALAELAHAHDLYLHMDGARLANAAARLELTLRQASVELGVDVLSFGGTKNGMLIGEAVICFRPELARHFKYLRKQGMQLLSKMRYLGAQFSAYLDGQLWLHNARHANAMARLLAEQAQAVPGVTIVQPVEANMVFARLPAAAIEPLQQRSYFYLWDEAADVVRWVTAWDTSPDDVRGFIALVREVMEQGDGGPAARRRS